MKEKRIFEIYDNIVFFDTETTGLDPNQCQIIEIAAIAYRNSYKERYDLEEFVQLRDPSERIPKEIEELTGITTEKVMSEGITEAEAAKKFADFVTGEATGKRSESTLLVAHNANFDLCFVRGWLRGVELPSKLDFLDTLTVFKDRRAYPHRLQNAIEAYGLENEVQNTHRAIDDVRALVAVTQAMEREREDLLRYINLFGYNPKYGRPENRLRRVTYIAQRFHNCMTSTGQALYSSMEAQHAN